MNVQIDYDKLAKSLVKAQEEAKKKQLDEEEKLQAEKSALWDEALGLKTYPKTKNWFVNDSNFPHR